ncbi:MAG: winged helix-turn-helix transcriptional regulator, partial [Desulfobacteraceae bacterium]
GATGRMNQRPITDRDLSLILEEGEGYTLEFPRPTYEETEDAPDRNREETRASTREKTRVKILYLIVENPEITASELAEAVGITPKGVEWQIVRLKKEGMLKRIGPAKGGRWAVKKNETTEHTEYTEKKE